ncbi:MAG TPA: fumarylacetoacetate hydrolase family protein, partial [Actinomycetota bacterium]|nr:fumarylacetoacetate hydrolase family protein [Actinomycetota bacterium]
METRRILLDGVPTAVIREGDELVAPDGRRVAVGTAMHLPPCEPRKIVCIHLNHESRVKEFLATLPPAPTYFHKPISSLNAHGGEVVRPPRCRYLNYEGEVAIVIGRECRHIAPEEASAYIA